MGLYWTGGTGGYRWRPATQDLTTKRSDLDTLARRLRRAYWYGSEGQAWRYIEYAAGVVIALSLIVLAAVAQLP